VKKFLILSACALFLGFGSACQANDLEVRILTFVHEDGSYSWDPCTVSLKQRITKIVRHVRFLGCDSYQSMLPDDDFIIDYVLENCQRNAAPHLLLGRYEKMTFMTNLHCDNLICEELLCRWGALPGLGCRLQNWLKVGFYYANHLTSQTQFWSDIDGLSDFEFSFSSSQELLAALALSEADDYEHRVTPSTRWASPEGQASLSVGSFPSEFGTPVSPFGAISHPKPHRPGNELSAASSVFVPGGQPAS
jgi:hypothetical protein